MKVANLIKSIFSSNRVRRKLRSIFVIFLNFIFIFSTYSGAFLALAKLNPVQAAYTSTDGYYDCGTSWPSYFNGEECYIRGTYLAHSGWNANAQCFMTNKIIYPDTGQQYNFCDPQRTAQLTDKEVIGFVRWNGDGTFNIINVVELAETFNQPPNQPGITRPQSGWEMGPRNNGSYTGVSCNTSGTGQGCSVDFVTSSYDPDFYEWIKLESQVTSTQGGNKSYNQTLTSNNQTYTKTQTLNDGNWNFRARNCDTTGECSGYTSFRTFIVDTTAPTGVTMTAEPEFSATTQNTVSSTAGTDNIVGGIEYEFQVDDDPTFTSPNNSSGWISANSFTFASLTDETTYYYRVRARDRLYNTGTWSTSVSSTQDSTLPVIQSVSINNERISPQNTDGQFDDTTLNFEWTEKYSESTRLEVVDANNTIVRTITDSLTTGSTTPITHEFTWNGRNDSNALVADGPYTMRVVVRDKAGNETIDDSKVVIVDSVPADINVSTPSTGSWFNISDITINGQTEADASAWITNNQTSTQTVLSLDALGLFSHNDTINLGANIFTLDAQDSVKNTSQITVNYYREESAPTIDSITPNNLINNRRPEITVNLTDTGYNDGINDYISGADPNSVYISLTHPTNGEIVLVNNGVNIQPTLGNIQQTCSTAGAFGNSTAPSCTYKFVFTADLTPDGNYTITAKAKDKAGNAAADKTQAFELDSNIQSDLTTPSNGNLFNYSIITLTGTAEKNSEVTITLPLGDVDGNGNIDTETFTVSDSATNAARVNISNCRASSFPSTDGIIEICDWTVTDFQLERDTVNPGNVSNQIKIDTKDNIDAYPGAGLNTKSQTITVNVDLYAVTLTLNTDIEYFSPNGDGRQDGVNFTDISTNGQIDTYTLEIKDSSGSVVKSFSAGGTPPSSIPWDGRDSNGNFVGDGTYTYQLKVTTTDGINFETTPVEIHAATTLTDRVIITYPKNNSFSSRGVITVQGQAPQTLVNSQTSELKVKICVDTITIDGTCDNEYYTTVDSNGFFSTIVMLPRINAQDEHYLTATALDKYGNETPPSNQVKVTTTSSPPFESVQVIPVLTGTNSPEAYQAILDKLDNGEEITQADIDALRSVIMRSEVYQGTERVRFFFADHSQVSELPGSTDWNSLGYITGDNQTKLYQGFTDGTTPYTVCNSTTCTWDFYYPLPSNLGGLYEVRFEGKLDQEVQNLTAGFTVDGNIPTTPILLDINKKINGNFANTNYIGGKFYSNSEIIQIKGASDPNASIEVKDTSGNTMCTTTASAVGIWICEVDTSTISTYSNPDSNVYNIQLVTYATLGLNTVQSVDNKTVVIDKVLPEILSVTTASQWRKSGDVVDQNVTANESMSYAISIDKQDPTDPDQCINSTATFDLLGTQVPVQLGAINDLVVSSTNLANAQGSFIVSGNAVEGRYCTTIKIADLAGNTASQKQIFFIDNTVPNLPYIDTAGWGEFNGIYTKPTFIAKGRLVPEFVHEENQVKIKAWSEENTKLEFYVNTKLITTTDLITSTCTQKLDIDKIADTVNVQDKDICMYEFTYPLTQNGKDYVFQVKSIDRAGNKSIISEDEVVYYDNQNPINPEVLRTYGTSYDPTPGWMLGSKSSITKDLNITLRTHAESLSDLEYTTTGPQGFNNYIFTQTPGNQIKDQEVPLGSISDEKDGCTQMIDTRRTGVCQDGNYTVAIKSTDAAGNPSGVTKHTVERDTVRPAASVITVSKTGDILGEYLKVSIRGEKNTSAIIQIDTSTGRSYRLTGAVDGNGNYSNNDLIGRLICGGVRYTISVNLVDKAGNVGFVSNVSGVSTTDCPVCGETTGLFEKPIHNDKAYIAHPYGFSENYFNNSKFHHGVDYNGVGRGEPIYAVALGKVIETRDWVTCENCEDWGYGNYVKIDHGNGVVSIYAHLQSVKVKKDDIVGVNTQIGTMGSSGYSTGPHLHLAVERNGYLQDPENYLGKQTSNLNDGQFASYCKTGGTGDGTESNPWDSRTADDLGKPKVHVKEYVGGKIETSLSPKPEITYIDNKTPGQIIVYGLGIYKYEKADYKYEKENCKLFEVFGGCFLGWSEWKTIEEGEKELQNTQIALYIEGQDKYTYVADLWNDATTTGLKGKDNSGNTLTKGKWLTNGTFSGDSDPVLPKFRNDNNEYANRKLKYGDKVCVKSVIFESFPHGGYIVVFGNCKQVDVKACSTTATGYDRCGAGEYAREYGKPGNRNSSYPNYSGSGGNCTNFASQVLHEAGKLPELKGGKVDQYWYFNSEEDRTATWAGAPAFKAHMVYWSGTLKDRFIRVSPLGREIPPDESYENGWGRQTHYEGELNILEEYYKLEEGDIISLAPTYPHNILVSKIDNNNIYIAANTTDYAEEPLFGTNGKREVTLKTKHVTLFKVK